MSSAATEASWRRLSEFVAEKMGLHFPPERWTDLKRGVAGAAAEFGFAEAGACVDWLLTAPLTRMQLQVLASHLTVGETYFFREKKAFEVFGEQLLPELVRSRRGREQRLRFWSVACCTGEEPYSLAILLHRIIPDLSEWHVTILATDINERFLQKAAAGVYGKWSFRESPPWLKESYFERTADSRFAILPEIKDRVTFAPLNLVEDVYPALATDTNAMDVIFCRNVLMYFTYAQAQKVVRNLRYALVDEGWLVVSPTEGSQALFSRFVQANFPGAILYQKSDAKTLTEPPPLSEPAALAAPTLEAPLWWTAHVGDSLPLESTTVLPTEEPAEAETPTPLAIAASFYQQGRYEETAETLRALFTANGSPNPQAFSLLARALANQGKLAEALTWCERWIAADKLDAFAHYLRAVIMQELGDNEQARGSLQRATYLQPGFVLAHFALGNLARGLGKHDEAARHFANALHLLNSCQSNELLPESDGLTAGRLTEIIASISALETSP